MKPREPEERQPKVVHDEPHPDGRDARGTLVATPFDEGFRRAIKSRWSHGVRWWDREEEVWWVAAGREDEVEELVLEHYGHAKVVDPDGGERYRDPSGDYRQGGLF